MPFENVTYFTAFMNPIERFEILLLLSQSWVNHNHHLPELGNHFTSYDPSWVTPEYEKPYSIDNYSNRYNSEGHHSSKVTHYDLNFITVLNFEACVYSTFLVHRHPSYVNQVREVNHYDFHLFGMTSCAIIKDDEKIVLIQKPLNL